MLIDPYSYHLAANVNQQQQHGNYGNWEELGYLAWLNTINKDRMRTDGLHPWMTSSPAGISFLLKWKENKLRYKQGKPLPSGSILVVTIKWPLHTSLVYPSCFLTYQIFIVNNGQFCLHTLQLDNEIVRFTSVIDGECWWHE